MGKKTAALKAKNKKLRKKIKRLKADLQANAAPAVSPLAPPEGFPSLPEIGGVQFAHGAAGVKYAGRDDVMLARVDAGSAVAGVFTHQIAETKVAQVMEAARQHGHPLQCTMEKE